jgi:hypothetical protein
VKLWTSLKRLLIAAAAVLSLQCSHTSPRLTSGSSGRFAERTHRTVYVDTNFRDDELKIIEESAQEWNSQTQGIARIVVVRLFSSPATSPESIKFSSTPDDIFLVKEESTSIDIVFQDYASNSMMYGLYQTTPLFSRIILVTDRFMTWEEYRTVVTHELGHALGLGHNNIKFTVMYRDHASVGNHITRDDLEQFCEIYRCAAEELLSDAK